MSAPTGPERVHICVTTSDGVTYDLTVRNDPKHPMTFAMDMDRPRKEVTDYAIDSWRRFEPGLETFVSLRLDGLVDGSIVRRLAPPAPTGPEPEVSTQDAPSRPHLTPQSDAEGSGVAADVREALGAQAGVQGATEAAPMTEAYEAAIDVLARKADTCGGQWSAAWVVPDDLLTEVLAAVWPLAAAEGRRQAVEAIRARVGDIAATEWAALIVEEEGRA